MDIHLIFPFVLVAFGVRDFLLLKTGPAARTFARLGVYSIVLVTSSMFFSAATFTLTIDRLVELIRSPRVAWSFVLLYGVMLGACLWVRRTARRDLAWLIAVIPNPLLIVGIAILGRFILPQSWDATIIGPSLLTCCWVAFVVLSVTRTGFHLPERDFSIGFAGLVNSAALVIVPVESFVTKSGWSSFLQQLGAILRAD